MKNKFPVSLQSDILAKRVFSKHQNLGYKDSKKTGLHFNAEGCGRAKITSYIKKYGECENVNFK